MSNERQRGAALLVLAAAVTVTPAGAQTIAERMTGVSDGRVRMTFAARPGVCGSGEFSTVRSTEDPDWEWVCDPEPVRVVLTLEDGVVTRVRTFLGGRWRAGSSAMDLGTVPAGEAADYLVDLAERSRGKLTREAIRPATMADSAVIWPPLLRIARDESRAASSRRAALRWVGIVAGETVLERAGSPIPDDPDRGIREQAVFALSQMHRDESVPALIEIARTHSDPQVRQRALFWLGQQLDSRAANLFEEILLGR